MSKHTARLIAALLKEGFVPPPPPQGAPPVDPNAAMPPAPPMPPGVDPAMAQQMPMDPNAAMPPTPQMPPGVDPAMAQQMPMDPAAMPPAPPVDPATGQPLDPAAMGAAPMPPVDPATGQPMDPNAGAMPPVPTVAEMPVDQFAAMMSDVLSQAMQAKEPESAKHATVADLGKRMEALEGMMAQLLSASGMMPPEQAGAPAPAEAAPMPPAPDVTQKTAALKELANKNNVKNAALASRLRKLGGVVR